MVRPLLKHTNSNLLLFLEALYIKYRKPVLNNGLSAQNGSGVSKPVERENLVTFNVSNSIIELEEGDDSYCSIEPGEENKFNSILETVVEEDCNYIYTL